MAEVNDMSGVIYQNLIDAGCDEQITEQCMSMVRKGTCSEMLPLLSRHRAALLGMVRAGQKQIDCLDYLVYRIKNESTAKNK